MKAGSARIEHYSSNQYYEKVTIHGIYKSFLPMSRDEAERRGWETLDFVLVSGDAYVDHPSFGSALIGRLLESRGFSVGIIAQPDWRSTADFKKLGRPRLAFLVTAGNMDSMVNKYTAAKKVRGTDAYSPGGKAGMRPDRATLVYATRAKEAYKGVPVILGGIEASLRRLAHYDYWSDKVRKSLLVDSKADILVYGMGERQIVEIAEKLRQGVPVASLCSIRGTVYRTNSLEGIKNYLVLPDFERVSADKRAFAESFAVQYENTDPFHAKTLAEPYEGFYAVQNPPAFPLTTKELDEVYELPYARTYHPSYEYAGGVPALEEVKFSLVSSRGCFGSCSFCALTFHQGRNIQSRSHESLIWEAERLIRDPDFKGYIHDVGGPTANFRMPPCRKQPVRGSCRDRQCLFPEPCKHLEADHSNYLSVLRKIRALPGVKKVFIRSGIRFDYLMLDRDEEFFVELCEHHVSGQLKVAPEHVSDPVLRAMGKPGNRVYAAFAEKYADINRRIGKKQFLVPYFISSHPGSRLEDAIALALYFKRCGFIPEQVQDFYPTPGTVSTCMYHTGLDPRAGKPIYVAKSDREKALQRSLLQFHRPQNYERVREALMLAGRRDLIGYGKECLIRPRTAKSGTKTRKNAKTSGKKYARRTRKD